MRTRTRVRNAAIGIVAATAATIAGCHTHQQSPSQQIHANHASTGTTTQQARADLDSLPVRPELPDSKAGSYEHTKWKRTGGCDTRAHLLRDESKTPVTYKKGSKCTVAAGQWADAYSGQTHHKSTEVQIDHMIPEKEAWVSGAHQWPHQVWQEFANDSDNGELVIASKYLNGKKSDSSPDEWQVPQDHQGQCAYTAQYLATAAHWNAKTSQYGGLSIDPKQKAAHKKQLDHC